MCQDNAWVSTKKTVVQKKTREKKTTAKKKEGISEGEPRSNFCTVSCSTLWRQGIAVCLWACVCVCGGEGGEGGGAGPSSFVKVRGHYRLTSTCPPCDCIWSWKKSKEKQKEKDCAKQLHWLLPVTSSKHWKTFLTFLTIEDWENESRSPQRTLTREVIKHFFSCWCFSVRVESCDQGQTITCQKWVK